METIEISSALWVDIPALPHDDDILAIRDNTNGEVYVERSEIHRLIEVLTKFERREAQCTGNHQ